MSKKIYINGELVAVYAETPGKTPLEQVRIDQERLRRALFLWQARHGTTPAQVRFVR